MHAYKPKMDRNLQWQLVVNECFLFLIVDRIINVFLFTSMISNNAILRFKKGSPIKQKKNKIPYE